MPKEADIHTKAAIETAVNSIAKEFTEIQREEEPDRTRYTKFKASQKHTAVFIGVSAFVVLIGAIWIINLKQFFTLLEFTQGSQNAIIETSRDDFNSILDELERKENAKAAGEQAQAAAAIGSALDAEQNKQDTVRAALHAALATTTLTEN